MIKFKKLKALFSLIKLITPDTGKAKRGEVFRLVIAAESLEVGKEMAELLSFQSNKEVPVFSLEPINQEVDLLVILLFKWDETNLAKVKDLIKFHPDYLLVSFAHPYLSQAFRAGREAGFSSHRLFVWNREEDYYDFFRGALKLAGLKKFALIESYPVFRSFLEELLIYQLALKFGWQSFQATPSLLFLFLSNFNNLKHLLFFSNSKVAIERVFSCLILLSLSVSLIQKVSFLREKTGNGKLARSLSVGFLTLLGYRLATLFVRKRVYER